MMEETEKKYTLLVNSKENQTLLQLNDKCDKYDYLVAVACGAIGGMIDIFLVGAPNDSVLGNWTDTQADNAVKGFAKISGWDPRETQKDNVASAIGYLERKFKINYDQRHSGDVGGLFNMSAKNHHIMSLSHSPDIIGLFFSILNQFISTSSFIDNGQLITIKTDTFELQGSNLITKLFCGIANWFGHIMSDIAGSSGTRGDIGRGTGVGIPFYELFQFCKFGRFNVGKDKQDLATIAVRAFQEGYDFRFGLATAIPVVITDLSIRLVWSLRKHFHHERHIMECIPSKNHPDLRIMLLFGNGTLCVMDGIDAGVRSGGNFLVFFMRLNLIAWYRFVSIVLKEVFIRVGILDSLHKDIESYKRINNELILYLHELEKLDIEMFRKETDEYNNMTEIFTNAKTSDELNAMLIYAVDILNINKPWIGSFNEHMSNENGKLIFE